MDGQSTTEAPDVGSGKAMKLAAEKAYDEIAEREGFDEHGDEIVDMSGDDEPVGEEPEIEDEAEVVEGEAADDDEVVLGDPEAEPAEGEEPSVESGEEPDQPPAVASGESSPPPPHTWPQEWKDRYEKMPAEMQQVVSEQVGHMNKVFSERMMALSEQGKRQEVIQRSIQPHEERLQRAGITPDVAVSRALAWDALIQRNPVEGIRSMAQAYGVDPQALQPAPAEDNRYLTPTERALQEQNQNLSRDMQGIQQYLARQQAETAASTEARRKAAAEHMLSEFMNATDEEGNLLHPHVEICAPMMQQLIASEVRDPETGQPLSLEGAYNMAAQSMPQVRQAREEERKAQQTKAAQAAAKKARKASSSGIVGGGNKKPKGGKAKTFEQRASEAYDKIANG